MADEAKIGCLLALVLGGGILHFSSAMIGGRFGWLPEPTPEELAAEARKKTERQGRKRAPR